MLGKLTKEFKTICIAGCHCKTTTTAMTAHVLNNIKKLVADKTCIIISNRISDIKDCDKIIVMEQGEIVENGTHDSLLENREKYYEFYKGQANKHEELA